MLKIHFVILLMGLIVGPVLARTSKQRSARKNPKNSKNPKNPMIIGLSTAINSNLENSSSPEHALDMDITLNTAFKLKNGAKINFLIPSNKDLKGERKYRLGDAYAGYSRKIGQPLKSLAVNMLGRFYLPLSKSSREDRKMITRLMLAPQFSLDMGSMATGLVLIYRPYANYYFYQYTTSLSGKSNYHYSLGNRLVIAYAINNKWSLTLDNIYSRATTHGGRSVDTFAFDQSITYAYAKNIDLSLGHNNSGNALAANGLDSAVELTDRRSATVYSALNYQF